MTHAMEASISALLATIILKVSAGTLLYLLLLAAARIDPFAAGMMLTFPALNGLALLFSSDPMASAQTMMLMPAINTGLVVVYVAAFAVLRSGAGVLALAGFVLWVLPAALTWAFPIPAVARNPVAFAAAMTIAGVIGAGMATRVLRGSFDEARSPAGGAGVAPTWPAYFKGHRVRIGLFVLSLAMLVSATAIAPGASALLGVLGGLPLVPLFGLWAVARGPDARPRLLRMACTVPIGAAIALWFVVLFGWLCESHALNRDWVASLLPLGLAWGVTFLAILGASALFRRVEVMGR